MAKTIGEKYAELKRLLPGGEAAAEARHILARALDCDTARLPLRFSDPLPPEAETAADDLARKRRTGMPLAYALREKNFYGYDFYVDERALIPRADTECVAERAVSLAKKRGWRTALDLCCGSGCVGVVLAKEAGLAVTLADISADALDVARRNAQTIAPECDFSFTRSDLFERIAGRFDLIVCNPPYIGAAEFAALEEQVRGYEPESALLAARGGLAFYERLAEEAGKHLAPGGALVLEIGHAQGGAVRGLLEGAGWRGVAVYPDLAGRDRCAVGFVGSALSGG